MKLIESIKLQHRANRYKNKDDKGGIAYINSAIAQGQTILDVGTHKAGYLYWMLKRAGNEGRIFAFEPQTNLYHYIKALKATFKWDNVTVEQIALSDSVASAVLYIPLDKDSKNSSPGATIVAHKECTNIGATETVMTDTLDLYCKRHNIIPDFLKIDVEGNELKIFQGGTNILKEYKPKILVEIEARHVGQERVLETFEFLNALGYHGQIIHDLIRHPLSDFDFDKYQNLNDRKNYCNNFIFE